MPLPERSDKSRADVVVAGVAEHPPPRSGATIGGSSEKLPTATVAQALLAEVGMRP